MADGRENPSSASNHQYNKFLIVDGGEYRWKGTFEQLETYFADNLPGAGSWSSPSGGVKLFTAKDFQIKWQRSKKLVIVRDTSDMYILKFFTQATVNDNTSPFNGPDADSNRVAAEVEMAPVACPANSLEAAINNKLDYVIKALDDFKLITNLQVENKKLKESLEDLSNRHNNLLCVASDLNTRIKDLENERSSVLTAVKLIYCDKNIHAVAEPTKNFSDSDSDQPGILSNLNEPTNIPVIDLEKREENESAKYNSAPVKSKHKGKGKKKSKSGSSTNCDNDSIVDHHCAKSPTDPSNSANSAPVKSKQKGKGKKKSKSGSSTNCDNDSIVDHHCAKSPTDPSNNAVIPNQGDHDDNYHNNSMQNHSLHDNQNTNMNTTKSDKKVTVIAGDSIVKNLHGWRLSDMNNHVVVKSFAGATIEDMEDYLKPVIRKEPESIILHVGTNDLKNLSPKQVANGIANLGSQISEESPNTNIMLSSIILRTDNPQLAAKAAEANKLINSLCSKNKWKFINHSSINSSCLNSRGLHLNRKGTSYVAKNLSQFITSK